MTTTIPRRRKNKCNPDHKLVVFYTTVKLCAHWKPMEDVKIGTYIELIILLEQSCMALFLEFRKEKGASRFSFRNVDIDGI